MPRSAGRTRRRWLATEVVQTSAMDCGPAALKCLLEGFGIPVSYGRLREACQTDVDGTSLDTIEVVANQLGLDAEQVMVPVDHLFLDPANLPALVVVRRPDGPTHFVVVWRRVRGWLQVMDPSVGRRWVRCGVFAGELMRHDMSVRALEWRAWAATEDALAPLRRRLAALGTSAASIAGLVDQALADPEWFACGALDAASRLVAQVVAAGGVKAGAAAVRLLSAVVAEARAHAGNLFAVIPPVYWSVWPDVANRDASHQRLVLRGAVLMRVSSKNDSRPHLPDAPLSPELVAALAEPAANPLRVLWDLLRADGLIAPLTVIGAMTIAVAATMVEALLFRGIVDVGALLSLSGQRLAAALALLMFTTLSLAFQWPIIGESLRFGRRLDARLRLALLRKLPHLSDRYFHSRPISDMADRSHSVQMTRLLPGMGIHLVQSVCELAITLAGVIVIDPSSAPLAMLVAFAAVATPVAVQPIVNERDLRVRTQAAALSRFYLDAFLGLVPIRAHRADTAVRRQHESLLVEWVRSTQRLMRASTVANAIQSLLGVGLAGAVLVAHFVHSQGVSGADLLLVYWVLKLPATGQTLSGLALQYPMQRNVLLRLLEPLAAPQSTTLPSATPAASTTIVRRVDTRGAHLSIQGGTVVAGGHTILRDLELMVRPGEHVAVVGPSGAGKSSLVGLFLGWHRLAGGRLCVDGLEIDETTLAAVRPHIAWIDPAVQIWNRSLLDNLTFSSRDGGAARAAQAIDAARLRGVLQALPQGLQTLLGEGGALLSGGEGQRVRLARTLAQTGVRLALLDEPFRGIDREQRSSLLVEARQHWRDATLLCVTHDVADTRAFDRVLVVEHGAIVEDDAPARLAARRSRYRGLLEAEQRVRERLWTGGQWRRVRVDEGRIEDVAEAWVERPLMAGRL